MVPLHGLYVHTQHIGLLLSRLIACDVTGLLLQFQALSQTFTSVILHFCHVHSVFIVHEIVFSQLIHAHVSSYMNEYSKSHVYHHVVVFVCHDTYGGVLSIHVTCPVIIRMLLLESSTENGRSQFSVNTFVHVMMFTPVSVHVNVHVTFWFVQNHCVYGGSYVILHSGILLFISNVR